MESIQKFLTGALENGAILKDANVILEIESERYLVTVFNMGIQVLYRGRDLEKAMRVFCDNTIPPD